MLIFFNDTATTEIYTLSLHDALPISPTTMQGLRTQLNRLPRMATWGNASMASTLYRSVFRPRNLKRPSAYAAADPRSEEHTSELQSRQYLVCRLLLEKKV